MGTVVITPAIDQPIKGGELPKLQLDALTSLRFFACALIVFFHSAGFFFNIEFMRKWQLEQGVTFFFVLSGFILTYVHPSLTGWQQTKQFLMSRLGRIWPSHFVMDCLALWLLPCSCSAAAVFWTHMFLVQSWMPRREYYFGLNAVAWSISVELFLYLCFVFFIRPWKTGWAGKLALGVGLVCISCVCAELFAASGGRGYLKFGNEFLLKICPAVRLLDFVIGMFAATLWRRYGHRLHLERWQATVLEAVVIAVLLIEITQINDIIAVFFPIINRCTSLTYYLVRGGAAPLFALLIFLAASQRGYITQSLTHPILVWLGEISYSTYMVHLLVLECLSCYIPEFFRINWQLAYLFYIALVILVSYLNFSVIENPFRKLVKLIASSSNSLPLSAPGLLSAFTADFKPAVLTLLLTLIVGVFTAAYIKGTQSRFQFTDLAAGNTDFGNKFVLEKICMANASDGSKIKLTWRSLAEQRLNRSIAFNLLDEHDNMLFQYDQDDMFMHPGNVMVRSGQLFTDTAYLPFNVAGCKKCKSLGLRVSVYKSLHPKDLLYVRCEQTNYQTAINCSHADWYNTRLVMPINKEAL